MEKQNETGFRKGLCNNGGGGTYNQVATYTGGPWAVRPCRLHYCVGGIGGGDDVMAAGGGGVAVESGGIAV